MTNTIPNSVYTGANFIACYMTSETDSSTGTTTYTLHPVGVGVKVGSFEHNYNVDKAFGIGDRVADVFYSKGFEGTLNFDAILEDSATTFVSKLISDGSLSYEDLYIVQLNGEVLAGSSPTVSEYLHIGGFKADGVKITARSGEYVGLSVDGKFRYSENVTNVSNTTLDTSALINTPLTFASATLTIGDSTAFDINTTIVKEFEIDIKNNIEKLLSLGNIYPTVLQEQKFEADITLNVYMDSQNWNTVVSALSTTTSSGEPSNNSNFVYDIYPNTSLTLTVTGQNHTYTIEANPVALESFSTSFEDANVVEGQMKLIAKTVSFS